ncbi:MAG: DUF2891 domain-containing protein [Bacteroidetes bacterium]|nr:DUF2891 domain-containing protein [Bacteroidota bacterium]
MQASISRKPLVTGLFVFMLISSINIKASQDETSKSIKLTQEVASDFARLALNCVHKEYPNKTGHVMNDSTEVLSPSEMHPAFYGCFDWHSSVHGHWMLVRLLKLFPNLPEAEEIRNAINSNLKKENILKEVEYYNQEGRKSFERTYGWAWLLKLSEELHGWNDKDGKHWLENIEPLTQRMIKAYTDFLPNQTYPVRTGVHPNTAFGISFALDYARKINDVSFEDFLIERSKTYFQNDKDGPALWEPGGEDFLSPVLIEADLMRRVLNPDEFANWFHQFLPGFSNDQYSNLTQPAIVSDRSDPKGVHLDGLNLSRAWCMLGILNALSKDDPVREILKTAVNIHATSALNNIATGSYEGEHWLASFAVYLLSLEQ